MHQDAMIDLDRNPPKDAFSRLRHSLHGLVSQGLIINERTYLTISL
jgi:hypothetical protein